MNLVIWTHQPASIQSWLPDCVFLRNHTLLAISTDNDDYLLQPYCLKTDSLSVPVIGLDGIFDLNFDAILTVGRQCEDEKQELIETYCFSKSMVISWNDLKQDVLDQLLEKYKDCDSAEIQKILDFYQKTDIQVFGTYIPPIDPIYRVFRDPENHPYIIFQEKRMYFPDQKTFSQIEGLEYIPNILSEQGPDSPHLYIRDSSDIPDNAVIVDAGVCEGNFALQYVEKAKKIYLIECDPQWIEPLKRTFAPYRDKVVLCTKRLGRYDNDEETTLDSLVHEPIDFLKMDIEGAETDALLDAKEVLTNSSARCAICTYHRQYDAKYCSRLLEDYGYRTEFSKGYMFFIFDPMPGGVELRRSILYGHKTDNR